MLILITADIHMGVPDRRQDIIWALERMRAYASAHHIDHWLLLGDLTHDRESLNIADLCALTQFLRETSQNFGQKIIAFPGNHDMYLKNSWDINSLKPLLPHLELYDKVSTICLDGVTFRIIPFIHYESNYMEILKREEDTYQDGEILLTHIGVRQSTLNTCFALKSWSTVEFTASPFKLVYTGHFHTHQQVGDNVWYPGSPIPFKFDEGDIDHGFMVLDTATMKHKFISIWDGVVKTKETPPQYLTLDDDSINEKTANHISGNIIRLALSHEYTKSQLDDIREHLQGLGARDVRWLKLNDKEERLLIRSAAAKVNSTDLFERYVIGSDLDGLDNKLLLRLNSEIVAEGDSRLSNVTNE